MIFTNLNDHLQIETGNRIVVWDKRRILLNADRGNDRIRLKYFLDSKIVETIQFEPIDLGLATLDLALAQVIPYLDYSDLDLSNYAKLDSENSWAEQQYWGVDTLTYAAAVTWDVKVSPKAQITLTGACTITMTNLRAGATYQLWVYQDGVGSHALIITDANTINAGGTTIPLDGTASSYDIVTIATNPNTNEPDCVAVPNLG